MNDASKSSIFSSEKALDEPLRRSAVRKRRRAVHLQVSGLLSGAEESQLVATPTSPPGHSAVPLQVARLQLQLQPELGRHSPHTHKALPVAPDDARAADKEDRGRSRSKGVPRGGDAQQKAPSALPPQAARRPRLTRSVPVQWRRPPAVTAEWCNNTPTTTNNNGNYPKMLRSCRQASALTPPTNGN